jgi:hypothetical protein
MSWVIGLEEIYAGEFSGGTDDPRNCFARKKRIRGDRCILKQAVGSRILLPSAQCVNNVPKNTDTVKRKRGKAAKPPMIRSKLGFQ